MQIEVKVLEVICDVILHLAALLQLREDARVALPRSAALDSTVCVRFLLMFCLVLDPFLNSNFLTEKKRQEMMIYVNVTKRIFENTESVMPKQNCSFQILFQKLPLNRCRVQRWKIKSIILCLLCGIEEY